MHVQSLYRNCLLCLRRNPKYINFTILNETLIDDLINIIKDEGYLRWSPIQKYCIINNYYDLNSLAVTRYRNSWYKIPYTPNIGNKLTVDSPIDCPFYDTSIGTIAMVDGNYYIGNVNYDIEYMECEKFMKLFPDLSYLHDTPEYEVELILESDFNKYPGLLELARECDIISKTIEIPNHYFEN